MTASAVATPGRRAPLLTRVASAVGARSAEGLPFGVTAVVALLHALDDAFLLPGALWRRRRRRTRSARTGHRRASRTPRPGLSRRAGGGREPNPHSHGQRPADGRS